MGQTVNRGELAGFLGVSTPSIDRFIKEGMPVLKVGGRGKAAEFDLAVVVQWYADRRAREAAGDKPTDLQEIDRRTATAKMELAELELAKKRGEVAPIRDFERATARLMATIQINIMNVPARAVLQLIGCTDESEFKTKLRAELQLALDQASKVADEIADDDEDGDDE